MAPAPPRPAGAAVAPGLSDAGAATVLELQKPRLPPIQTPFSVVGVAEHDVPVGVRGAGWFASGLRAACC